MDKLKIKIFSDEPEKDFANLNYQNDTGTCMEILSSVLKSCVGAVIIGFFVSSSDQSASVKSSTAGVLTSTLQSLPPGFFYSALFVCVLNTLLISSMALYAQSWITLNYPCLNVSVNNTMYKKTPRGSSDTYFASKFENFWRCYV